MTTADLADAAPALSPRAARGARLAEIAALAALLVGLAMSVVGLVIGLSPWGRPGAFESTPLGELGAFVFAVTLLAMGYVLRSRRPANVIGWVFLAFGVVVGLSALLWDTMLVAYLPGGNQPLGAWASWLGAVVTIPLWTWMIAAIGILFPDGRVKSVGESRVLRSMAFAGVAVALTTALRPGPMLAFPAFDNPVAVPTDLKAFLTAASNLAVAALVLPTIYLGSKTVGRYRRATSIERFQLRWFAFGASLVVASSLLYVGFGLLAAPANSFVREATYALMVLSLSSLPIAVFQAIASHNLYEIDRIIGRTFAYGALTAILAGLYAASLRLTQGMFVAMTGEGSDAALVVTTLVLTTTFTPIKTRLEKVAAKRFPPEPHALTAAAESTPVSATGDLDSKIDARIDARLEGIVRRAVDEALRERDATDPR